MIRCSDAARLLSEAQERDLELFERLGLKLHLLLCHACARYARQVRLIARLCERLEDAEATPPRTKLKLSAEARKRIKINLRD